ncbi:MAG: M13 family metallopeptidase [Pseudomonadota bacterium]
MTAVPVSLQFKLLFKLLCATLTAALLGGCAAPSGTPDVETPPAVSTNLPFEVTELSAEIRPQDDFWGYVNAEWIAQTEIPADRSSYGTFHILIDRTESQIRAILDDLGSADSAQDAASEAEQTIGNLYQSFMDEQTINSRGLQPLQTLLAPIDDIQTTAQLTEHMGKLAAMGVTTPIAFYADNDATDATRLILYLWQWGLGLPNRDYYLEDQQKLADARQQYLEHIAKMYDLAGWSNGEAAAAGILQLETTLATLQWTQVQNRDREQIYSNQYDPAATAQLLGGLPLNRWFEGFGISQPDKIVIAQTSYFEGLDKVLRETPMATWRAYLKFHLLANFAPYLSDAFAMEGFRFNNQQLRGQEEQAPRWKRGVRLINRSVGELLGQIYVQRHFDPAAKSQVLEMVENLRAAFALSIDELTWMSPATKDQAVEKLSAFLPKLGYPDRWRDFSGLSLQPDTLLENLVAVRQFNHAEELQRLQEPVDRALWTTNPQTVNAFYRPTHNSITFPAGILQTPMFDKNNDPAMNYGAIGSVIGHEFSHGFDDQGRKFDGIGLLRNWWTDEDAAKYKARADVLVEQFDQFQPLPDMNINGRLSLGENIGDLAGVTMAYRAFELSGYADGPAIEGLSPRQRFFIGYALAFRGMMREPLLRQRLLRGPHSPNEYRVTGPLRNVPGFYEAFDVQADDGMYLPPEERVKIW